MNDTPSAKIFIMEDHDEAYYAWKRLGIKNATLVHIDAHIDIAWFNAASPQDLLKARTGEELDAMLRSIPIWNPSPDQKAHKPNIGNYICSAIRDGIVDKVYWIVPDDFLDTQRKIRYLKKVVEGVVSAVPGKKESVTSKKNMIRTKFHKRELIVCCLSGLPDNVSNVLLDIDTDFLMMRHDFAQYKEFMYLKSLLPWMWPDELADILKRKKVDFNVATIAYSVEGYYTPIAYKFLGDWVKLMLEGKGADEALIRSFVLLKEAAVHRYNGHPEGELAALGRAAGLAPDYAAIHFILSRAQYEAGQTEEARRSYHRAISLDGSYRTSYNNAADIFRSLGMFDRMDREGELMFALDPENASVHLSRGDAFFAREDRRRALETFTLAATLDPRSVTAKYSSAEILCLEKRYDGARVLLEEVLNDEPNHFGARLLLGAACMHGRQYDQALEHYRTILRLGYCDPWLYLTMARLYGHRRDLKKAFRSLRKCIALLPAATKAYFSSRWESALFRRKVSGYAGT